MNLSLKLAARLSGAALRLVTAESLTGGRLAAALTTVPGSSAYFQGGVVAYSNQLKVELLGVPLEVILRHGAVSRECALAMAEGARRKLGADAALASTGIAGPGGATPAKPVGLVWLAVAGPRGLKAVSHVFVGDRAAVTGQAVRAGLELLLAELA
ncbi:MAG: CinA family protein [Candidatus Adiutrix sp.]|jgi:nicotinamide-nucleotide amidase|nr:CinA family protein [Candidatus Adiutrix sp.]